MSSENYRPNVQTHTHTADRLHYPVHTPQCGVNKNTAKLEMWANAQRDGRPDEYRWCPLFNAAKFG